MRLSSCGAVTLTDAGNVARLICGAVFGPSDFGFAAVAAVSGARLDVNGLVDAATDAQARWSSRDR